eukprot:gene9331-10132_t
MFAVRRSLRVVASARSFTSLGKATLAKAVVASSMQPLHRNAGTLNLEKALKAEIKYEEKDENREFAEEYLQVKEELQQKWKFDVHAEKSEVTLTRTYKNEKITVNYDVQNIAEDIENNEQQEQEEEEDEEQQQPEAGYGLNFDVVVENDHGALRFDCAGNDAGVTIRNVAYYKEYNNATADGYTGPDFSQLDPDLQEQFFHYLEERGIDNELCSFIVSHAEEVENTLYLGWLKNVYGVVGSSHK